MTRGRIVVAAALVGTTAILVGFQGASTLLTVTQIGASAEKPKAPRSHASLVPKPPLPAIKPDAPKEAELRATGSASAPRAGEDARAAPQPSAGEQAAQVVTDNQPGIAAALKAKAMAEMDAMELPPDEDARPVRERPRKRYRAPRPELHKVY
jgi:hypothetical protein